LSKDIGSVLIELKYLAQLIGDDTYRKFADNAANVLAAAEPADGLILPYISLRTNTFSGDRVHVNEGMSLYYDALLKQHLMLGQSPTSSSTFLDRYRRATASIESALLLRSPSTGLFVFGSVSPIDMRVEPKMDRTACKMAGQLALGATLGVSVMRKQHWTQPERLDLLLAMHIEETCWQMYATSPIGLAPEVVWFWRTQQVPSLPLELAQDLHRMVMSTSRMTSSRLQPRSLAFDVQARSAARAVPNVQGKLNNGGLIGQRQDLPEMSSSVEDRSYFAWPEELESLFILWRITGDTKYRERGWKIFEAIDRYCRVLDGGYSGLADVSMAPPMQMNRMEPHFLSQTLKYLYLLFSPNDLLPLNKYVFNTAGHPLPIRS